MDKTLDLLKLFLLFISAVTDFLLKLEAILLENSCRNYENLGRVHIASPEHDRGWENIIQSNKECLVEDIIGIQNYLEKRLLRILLPISSSLPEFPRRDHPFFCFF